MKSKSRTHNPYTHSYDIIHKKHSTKFLNKCKYIRPEANINKNMLIHGALGIIHNILSEIKNLDFRLKSIRLDNLVEQSSVVSCVAGIKDC